MDRILRGTAATIEITFSVDDVDTDPAPDSATIEVLRDDGTTLIGAGTATTPTGTGSFGFTLTPTETATLDRLTANWTANLSSHVQTLTTQVEVVGGLVCTLAQIDDQLNRGGSASAYSVALKRAARDVAIDAFESVAGCAFSPRYASRTFDGPGRDSDLFLPTPRVTAIRSASIDGTALTTPEVDALDIATTGAVWNTTGWGSLRRSVTLAWEHGFTVPPADVSRAVAILAASVLKDGPFDDRGYAVTEDGGAVRLLTGGVSGAAFSIPDVEAAVRRHSEPVIA